jgi:hypothetical protein
MSEQIVDKKGLDEIMKVVPPSFIATVKPPEEVLKENPNTNIPKHNYWGSKSNQLLNDYKYGENLALYGENDLTTQAFFKRFTASICAIISNEFLKRGTGAESLKPYYNILESCMLLISKEIDKKELKDYEILSIIASLDGFVTNYNQRKEK